MRQPSRIVGAVTCLAALLAIPCLARAQWDEATWEPVCSGPEDEWLGKRSLALDDAGTLHAAYTSRVGEDTDVYYRFKPAGGAWSEPEIVGDDPGHQLYVWLEVRKETGEPYIVFPRERDWMLAVRRGGAWTLTPLVVPPPNELHKLAMAVDREGRAHFSMVVRNESPFLWQIGYAYWDGTDDLHFQLREQSGLVENALFAYPIIVARPDGSVVMAWQNFSPEGEVVAVAWNEHLGGTFWSQQHVRFPGWALYPESLVITPQGHMHLSFNANLGMGTMDHVGYTWKRAKSEVWEPIQWVAEGYPGARVKMAVSDRGEVHLVFDRTHRAKAVGDIVYVNGRNGKWRASYLVQGSAFDPSLVLDPAGHCSILFRREIINLTDNDIEFYGYVEPPS